MKQTKNYKKKRIITTAIIVIAIVVWVIIAKTCKTQTPPIQETTTTNGNVQQWELTLEITAPEEEPADEKRSAAPAEIKQITEKNWVTYLTLDMLTINSGSQLGATDFFINQNPKIRDIALAGNAKAFTCDTNSVPTVSVSIKDTVTAIQQSLSGATTKITYSFDIVDGIINAIYQRCTQ